MDLEFSDICFPRSSCIGVTINMQQSTPIIALMPSFKYRRKIMAVICMCKLNGSTENYFAMIFARFDKWRAMRQISSLKCWEIKYTRHMYIFIYLDGILLLMARPRCNERSRRNSLCCTHLRPWDSSEFQRQLLVDGSAVLYLCQMASLPRRYSKKTIEELYRKSVPKQSNEMSYLFDNSRSLSI